MPNYWYVTIMDRQYMISPYLFFNGLGLIVGLLYLDEILKKKFPNTHNKVYVLFVVSVVIGWISAYFFDYVITAKSSTEAGFMFYGGLIGGLLFYITLCKNYLGSNLILPTLNSAVIPFVFSQAIGRIGCFFAGCCYGIPLSQNHHLTLLFTNHPTQLYESSFLLLLSVVLFKLKEKYPLSLIYIYLISYGSYRFFIEMLRGDKRVFFHSLSSSQWISLVILVAIISLRMAEKMKLFYIKKQTSRDACILKMSNNE